MYGIPNCDTIKKAKKWLVANEIEFEFHDYRKQGIDANLVEKLLAIFGIDAVINKRGTTYRQLSDEQKANLDETSAIALLVESPAMIKRPILLSSTEEDTHFVQLIGFKADDYARSLIN
jgi:Spx/MgsR family transcriptional regulator